MGAGSCRRPQDLLTRSIAQAGRRHRRGLFQKPQPERSRRHRYDLRLREGDATLQQASPVLRPTLSSRRTICLQREGVKRGETIEV